MVSYKVSIATAVFTFVVLIAATLFIIAAVNEDEYRGGGTITSDNVEVVEAYKTSFRGNVYHNVDVLWHGELYTIQDSDDYYEFSNSVGKEVNVNIIKYKGLLGIVHYRFELVD